MNSRLLEAWRSATSPALWSYVALFFVLLAGLGVAYAFLRSGAWTALGAMDQDTWSGVFQATVGVAVAFAGALVAIVLATSAERLSKTGILLAEAEDRRSRIKECTELIDTTQQRYADLAIAMRSFLGEAALGPEVREALDMHTLDRLIRQPEPGFTRYLNPPSHRYPSLSAPAYRARVEAVARLGALAQGESFPGSGNWEPDEPVRRRAAKLVRALEAGFEMQQDRAAEIAAAKLDRMGDASLSLAGAIEATMGNLYCRGLVLAPNETEGTVRIERARRAAEGFRSIARGLQARRDSAIEFLGEVAATVHLLFPRPFKGLSRLPYP